MDTNALQQFKDALGQNDRVGIIVGKNPSMDDMAAALGLYLSLKAAQKPAVIASATQPIVEHSSLVGLNDVKPSLGGAAGDLVVSFPYQEGEIEKVSYTIEAGFLNIVVKAGHNGLTFTEQDVRFTRGGAGLPTLLIVVGTAQLAALGELFNPEALKDTTIVNIDNKPDNQGFGDIILVSTQYSSVSEVVANMILTNGLPIDVDIAQNLMNGISFATNNFQNPQTSYFAFEIVAELLRRGAVRTPVQMPQQPMPSFMQQPAASVNGQMPTNSMNTQMSRPAPMPRSQSQAGGQGGQGMRQPFGQQRGQQNQQRTGGQRMNQGQNQQPNQNQPQRGQQSQSQNQQQNNRQDEIRRALAEQARQARMNQQPDQHTQNQPQPQQQPMPQSPLPQPSVQQPPMPQAPVNAQGTQEAPQTEETPSDWLTPKVYKGSSNLS
jgi:hypothetical protein